MRHPSTIHFIHNPEMYQRTKHIEIKHVYVQGKQQEGAVNITYLNLKKTIGWWLNNKEVMSSKIRKAVGKIWNNLIGKYDSVTYLNLHYLNIEKGVLKVLVFNEIKKYSLDTV